MIKILHKLIKYEITKILIDNILAKKHQSELYCQKHQLKLILNKIIFNHKTPIEIGYCPKCNKEYSEYSDINPIYISNYEWMYNEYK